MFGRSVQESERRRADKSVVVRLYQGRSSNLVARVPVGSFFALRDNIKVGVSVVFFLAFTSQKDALTAAAWSGAHLLVASCFGWSESGTIQGRWLSVRLGARRDIPVRCFVIHRSECAYNCIYVLNGSIVHAFVCFDGRYVDVAARAATLRATHAQLVTLMKRANDVDSVLKVW